MISSGSTMHDYPTQVPRGRIVSGAVLAGLGVAFGLGLWPIGYLGGARETFSNSAHIGPWMIPAFVFFFTGVGLLAAAWLRGTALMAWGAGVGGFGFGLTLGLWPIGFIPGVESDFHLFAHIGPWMIVGFLPLFIGLALVLADLILRPHSDPPTNASRHESTGTHHVIHSSLTEPPTLAG